MPHRTEEFTKAIRMMELHGQNNGNRSYVDPKEGDGYTTAGVDIVLGDHIVDSGLQRFFYMDILTHMIRSSVDAQGTHASAQWSEEDHEGRINRNKAKRVKVGDDVDLMMVGWMMTVIQQ